MDTRSKRLPKTDRRLLYSGLSYDKAPVEGMKINGFRVFASPPLGLSKISVKYLHPGEKNEFVLSGKVPLTYTRLRKICERLKKDTQFSEKIIPRRFRTTVLTDIYQETHDIKQTQAAAGHTTSAMTLKYYVKGRGNATSAAAAIDSVYSLTA